MTTEDKSRMPLFSSEDEKDAQKVPDHPRENGTLKVARKWTGFQGKTMWDWLQLLSVLAIPLVVVGASILFGIQQANLANQQHEADQRQALDQQQATILQMYIDNIQDLLLHENLRGSKQGDEVAILARARTLTALQGLDSKRKGLLVQFINEAHLIGFDDNMDNPHSPIIDLSGANLSGANLSHADLRGAFLFRANLSHADLSHALLGDAYLSHADLSFATLTAANLLLATLSFATLSGAKLDNTILLANNLTQQQLDQVYTCKGAFLPQGLICHNNQ